MKRLMQRGAFSVVEQHRVVRSPKTGLRGEWTEYQVRCGLKVISRHERLFDAERAAAAIDSAEWDAIAKQLKSTPQ